MKLSYVSIVASVVIFVASVRFGGGDVSIYSVLVFSFIVAKLVASARMRPYAGAAQRASEDEGSAGQHVRRPGRVAGVVAFYNEDPGLFRAMLASLDTQTQQPDSLWLVDDGSTSTDCYDAAMAWASGRPAARVARIEHSGKRHAQAVAFRGEPDAAVFLTVDSDTILEPDAVAEALKPFDDPAVTAVTGVVSAANYRRNLLTRLIDVRYANAFLWERAAYSAAGSVLCTCGSLALYRADVVRAHLDDFLDQRFLGRVSTFGDDRRLTNYALAHGRAVLQLSARARTAVPERLGHFVRQQVRWNKSFFRESLWAIQNLPLNRPAAWLSLVELTSWVLFTALLLLALVVSPLVSGTVVIGAYILYVALMSYVRSLRFVDDVEARRGDRWISFALSPLYGFMHITLLVPLRLYSLCTLRRNTWGTRQRVEVAAS